MNVYQPSDIATRIHVGEQCYVTFHYVSRSRFIWSKYFTRYTQWDQEKCPLNGVVHLIESPLKEVLLYFETMDLHVFRRGYYRVILNFVHITFFVVVFYVGCDSDSGGRIIFFCGGKYDKNYMYLLETFSGVL